LISEGYYLQGDWDSFNERSAYAESLEENCSDDFTVEDKVIFCEILCLICQSVVLFGRDEELAELNPLPIEELKDWCSHQEFQLGGRIIAQLMMIEAIRRYRAGLTDDMHRYLCNLDLACYEAFGSRSYQYARAKLIYRIFAWENGYEIVDYPGNYIRSLDHGHYRKDVRTVDFSSVDQKVRLQLMREYDFFSELDRNTVPPKDRERIALARQEFYDKVVLENDYICERY
jgi:hypothetical protein